MVIGESIKELRARQNLTQAELATKTGISRSYLADVERGRYNPSLDTLSKIADALGTTIDSLTEKDVSTMVWEGLERIGMSQEELAEKSNVPLLWLQKLDTFSPGQWAEQSAAYEWISRVGKVIGEPSSKMRMALARHELSYDDERLISNEDYGYSPDLHNIYEIDTTNLFKVPILGVIQAGSPIFAEENIEGYMFVDTSISRKVSDKSELFYLRITGDSMTPKYQPDDLVLVRKQSDVDDGEVAVILIEDENATLKKIYRINGEVWLHSTNPNYEPFKVSADKIRILGKAILRVG